MSVCSFPLELPNGFDYPNDFNCVEYSDVNIFNRTHKCAGVYGLVNSGNLVYVGESGNILKRVCEHIVEGKKNFNGYIVFFTGGKKKYRQTKEKKLIQFYSPKYNVVHNKKSKPKSLYSEIEKVREKRMSKEIEKLKSLKTRKKISTEEYVSRREILRMKYSKKKETLWEEVKRRFTNMIKKVTSYISMKASKK